MMPARHAVVITVASAAVHGVVIALIASHAFAGRSPRLATTRDASIEVTYVESARQDDTAVTLVILAEPTRATQGEPTRSRTQDRRAGSRIETGRAAAVSASTTAGSSTEPGHEPGTSTGPSKMRMRGHDLGLRMSEKLMADFLANTKPLVEIPISGKLAQRGREHVVNDLVVTMKIHEDGQVTLKDKPDGEVHWALPIPSRKGIGDHLAGWYADPYAQTKFRKVQDMAPHEQAVEGGWDAGAGGDTGIDGNVNPIGKQSGGPTVPIIGGSFDITAYAMRKFGIDPYASRKLKLLDETREERAAIGSAHAANQLDRSSELMQRNVEQLWSATIDPAMRRQSLFALWDECDEGESSRGAAGARARAIVIGWIRAHVPAGSATAFTATEIAALDQQRTSRQHFVPY